MSHPRLGISSESKGDFNFFVEINDLQLNLDDEMNWAYQVNFSNENLTLDNEYFKELFEQDKIVLVSNLYCSRTLYQDYNIGLNNMVIPNDYLDGILEISFYLAANKDFIFDAPEGTVNTFFDDKIPLKKGEILSAIRTQRLPFDVSELNGNYHPIKFSVNRKEQTDGIEFIFDDDSDHISVYFPEQGIVRLLKQLQDRHGRKYKDVFRQLISVPIHIEAARRFIELKGTGTKEPDAYTKWHNYFNEKYSLDQYENLDDFNFGIIYNQVSGDYGPNNSLVNSLTQLNEIFSL